MILFNLTKRINKALAPKLLTWSLRLHESLSSSSTIGKVISPNAFSLLPLAQRLVSIEVQDDYRQLKLGNKKGKGDSSSAWDQFVDQTWNVFFEDRHQRLKAEQQKEEEAEAEAQRLWEAKQQRKRRRRKGKIHSDNVAEEEEDQKDELIQLGELRVQLLEKYVRPALLPTASSIDRHLFTHHHHQEQRTQSSNSISNNSYYDNFIKWIRGEYLIAKYGLMVQKAVKQHPELRDDAAGLSTVEVAEVDEGAEVPLILTSVDTIQTAFGMGGWSRNKVPYSSWADSLTNDDKSNNAGDDASSTPIDHIIHHHLKGQIAHSGPLNAYFEMRRREDSYELWTRDYIFGLARYLLDRIAVMDQQQQSSTTTTLIETIILDVGAGDGRLAFFLRRAMKEMVSKSGLQKRTPLTKKRTPSSPDTFSATTEASSSSSSSSLPTIIATDDGSWRAPIYNNRHIQVEQLSALESLDKYGPETLPIMEGEHKENDNAAKKKTRLIVLCSWMPPGQDWTIDFRRPLNYTTSPIGKGDDDDATSSETVEGLAEEYILIGEADDGTCGHNWYTWGNAHFAPLEHDMDEEAMVAPHVVDGYERVDLEELSMLQFSRFDCERSSESKTVSFRRGVRGYCNKS